ncbi:response regulator [Paraliomyxa miuraensis]|uniref:response regulator n=1 Tax=Paraliomyxa miuraensis TaxID=376150 RepID=UPI0022542A92|nr:response regulator transcription factor [Paraliomyxa miuraensis]MCX4244770.1 response regulator transcription factor [Paraliomyxa miuraensis]
MKRARILLADDHRVFLEALRSLLEPRFDVVGTVTDGKALVQAALHLEPDVVVSDVSMPGGDGLEAARRLLELVPGVGVVLLTVSDDPALAALAMRMGVRGYVLKTDASTGLVAAIDAALVGDKHISHTLVSGTLSHLSGKEPLTERQTEVLRLLVQGHTMKEVAAALSLSPRTVAFHKYRIMEALGVASNAALLQHAVARGMSKN